MNQPTLKSEIEEKVGKDIAKIGFSKAMQKKWIQLAAGNKDKVERISDKLYDDDRE